jgi:hypothetical protein
MTGQSTLPIIAFSEGASFPTERDRNSRFLAQPPLMPTGLLDLDRHDGAHSPVEHAVRLGLQRPGATPGI